MNLRTDVTQPDSTKLTVQHKDIKNWGKLSLANNILFIGSYSLTGESYKPSLNSN